LTQELYLGLKVRKSMPGAKVQLLPLDDARLEGAKGAGLVDQQQQRQPRRVGARLEGAADVEIINRRTFATTAIKVHPHKTQVGRERLPLRLGFPSPVPPGRRWSRLSMDLTAHSRGRMSEL
jgi:hypothetical protein